MSNKNLRSLELLRNGKVYGSRNLALQAFLQSTNDGVAKLSRYLDSDNKIKTIVGFYADSDEMVDAGGGESCYTIFDLEGLTEDLTSLQAQITAINGIIGDGIESTTLTNAINAINAKIGDGFDSGHTVSDALEELEEELRTALEVTLEIGETTAGYLKTYDLKQGGELVGKIDIPKDMVVSGGSLVHGTWIDEDTFVEDPQGVDTAIKIEFANADVIYINTRDLVVFYESTNAAIEVDNSNDTITLKLDEDGEVFLSISDNGLKLDGVQVAINKAVKDAELSAGDGISIVAKSVKSVAALNSGAGIKNPISVDADGIKFDTSLDCGFWDMQTIIATDASQIEDIAEEDRKSVNLVVTSEDAIEALDNSMIFNTISVYNTSMDNSIGLSAKDFISIDGLLIDGGKDGDINAKVTLSASEILMKNITVGDESTAYNVFDSDHETQNLVSFEASDVIVDDMSLQRNVFNIFKPKDNANIKISNGKFNLNVNKSNTMHMSNMGNATGVTVVFENIDWSYEDSIDGSNWSKAALLSYQPYSSDMALVDDLTALKTWTFKFKNCRYNGEKVTSNNFEEHNQVFYLYNIGNDGQIKNPSVNGLT